MPPAGRAANIPPVQKLKGSAALLAAYVAVVLLATQLPFAPDTSPASLAGRLARAVNPVVSGRDAVDALRNMLLFAGWGVIWVLTRPARRPTSPGGAAVSIRGAAATALLLSAVVEILQLFSAERTASILDVATNTGGALVGAACVVVMESLVRQHRGRPSYLGIPGFLLAGGYGTAVVLEGFAPLLRQQRIPGLWGSAMERVGGALEGASVGIGAVGMLDVVLFAPAGMLVVMALAELGIRRSSAATLTAVLALPVMLAAELLHGGLGHAVVWAPAVVHAIAIAAGGAAGAYWLPGASRALRGRARPVAVYVLFATLLPLWTWRPFSPTPVSMLPDKLALVQFVPLAAYRERMDVFTAVDVMIPVLILAPIGALLAVWPLRRTGPLAGLWPGVWAALVLEGMQVFVAGRYFDITDVLVQVGALLVGWSVARRAGYVPYGEALPEALPGSRRRG